MHDRALAQVLLRCKRDDPAAWPLPTQGTLSSAPSFTMQAHSVCTLLCRPQMAVKGSELYDRRMAELRSSRATSKAATAAAAAGTALDLTDERPLEGAKNLRDEWVDDTEAESYFNTYDMPADKLRFNRRQGFLHDLHQLRHPRVRFSNRVHYRGDHATLSEVSPDMLWQRWARTCSGRGWQ